MPRVNLGGPPKQTAKVSDLKQMEDAVVDRFGLCLDLQSLMKVLGLKDQKTAKEWIRREGIPAIPVSEHKKRYWAQDVVRALHNAQFRA